MKLKPIINSLLDTDLYKFNMNQVMFHKHTDLSGKYYFKCRNIGVKFTEEMIDEIVEQVNHLCKLKFKRDELDYLRNNVRFLKSDYIEFLRLWHPINDYVDISNTADGELRIVVHGPLFSAMQFEIYLLSIISEVYFRMAFDYDKLLVEARKRLQAKIEKFKNHTYSFKVTDFGGRRRSSREWHEEIIETFIREIPNSLFGTSNVYLAMKYHLKPVGTYAHEFVQMYQGIPSIPLAYSNKAALEDWYDEYKGDNGIALTDTITTDAFLLDFDRANCNNYTGVRHDSGDPYAWGEKIINHYKKYGIDPKTKTLLFSDSLNFDKAQQLYNAFRDRTNVAFGIGTFITNDMGETPLNIVIKLQEVNGQPVAKLSDCEGKVMCQDNDYVAHLREEIKFRLERETK